MPNFSWTQVDTKYVKAQDYNQNSEIALFVKEYKLLNFNLGIMKIKLSLLLNNIG